jgi:hypothetical protein
MIVSKFNKRLTILKQINMNKNSSLVRLLLIIVTVYHSLSPEGGKFFDGSSHNLILKRINYDNTGLDQEHLVWAAKCLSLYVVFFLLTCDSLFFGEEYPSS